MTKHDVTETQFSQNFSTDFSETFVADVKLMLGNLLKVSRRYLQPFLSYRENSAAGGAEFAPPPAGRMLIGFAVGEVFFSYSGKRWPCPRHIFIISDQSIYTKRVAKTALRLFVSVNGPGIASNVCMNKIFPDLCISQFDNLCQIYENNYSKKVPSLK